MMIDVEQAAKRLLQQDRVCILAHASPDGDTLGSAYGLYYALRELGKQARVRCADPVPSQYAHLCREYREEDFEEGFVMAVDVASPKLLGSLEAVYAGRIQLCLDHHPTNEGYAQESCVWPQAAATCELVYEVVRLLGAPVTPMVADCLYTGIATDSGCFKYPSTSPQTHRMAAQLMEAGADYSRINERLFDTKTKGRILVEQAVLNSIRFFAGDRVALITIPRSLLEHAQAAEGDLDGLAALPRMIEGVDIGLTLREKEEGIWKVSVRTGSRADASVLCGKFGGGGHARASGCLIRAGYDEAVRMLTEAAEQLLEPLE